MHRLAICLLLAATCAPLAALDDVDLGPDAKVSSDPQGRYLIVDDPRTQREYLINKSRIVVVRSAKRQDDNSVTEIYVQTADNEKLFVLRIQERNISYQAIRLELLK